MHTKRGQITILIIIGMVILLSFFLVYYVQQTVFETSVRPEIYVGQSLDAQKDSVEHYVDFCLTEVIEPQQKQLSRITALGLSGGRLLNSTYGVDYNGVRVHALCSEKSGEGCVSHMLLLEEMESQLDDFFILQLLACIDLDDFRDKGYSIESDESSMNVDTTIAKDHVMVQLNYPMELSGESRTLELSEFSYKANAPLGRLYELAVDITNDPFFDKDVWMIEHNAQVMIEKHKPYPDIVYSLNRQGYTFQFAIKGVDTVGHVYPDLVNAYGCCVVSGMCFENVKEEECSGEYDYSSTCECDDAYNPLVDENNYMANCGVKSHGESWCMYESIVGESFDYVGSRHSVHTCINGEVITERCRDFREEICVEERLIVGEGNGSADFIGNEGREGLFFDDGRLRAQCRVNRWQDCHVCEDESCCVDTEVRDCDWNNFLETDIKCTPAVPPGLRFWETGSGPGSDVCSVANVRSEFDLHDVRNAWIDSTAFLCLAMGDCGNSRNVVDHVGVGGFRNSDGEESAYVHLETGHPYRSDSFELYLPFDAPNQRSSQTLNVEFSSPSNYPSAEQIAAVLENLDAYKRQVFRTKKRPALSQCGLWQAPTGVEDCYKCDGPSTVCSEYRCRSLGEQCQFTNYGGIPQCFVPGQGDVTPPTLNVVNITEGYHYESAEVGSERGVWFSGFEMVPAIRPHEPITFGIETNEPTRCSMNYLPQSGSDILPDVWFGLQEYQTQHNLTFRFPKEISFPDGFVTALNATSLGSLSGIVGSHQRLALLKLLDEFNQGKYYLFVSCSDKYGNTNTEEFFIRFTLDTGFTDVRGPQIVRSKPIVNSTIARIGDGFDVTLYLNQPATCRASVEEEEGQDVPGYVHFNEMNISFDCPTSSYSISPVEGGTYKCEGRLPYSADRVSQYVIGCEDNPIEEETLDVTVVYGNELSILSSNGENTNASNGVISVLEGGSYVVVESDVSPLVEVPVSNCRMGLQEEAFDEMEDLLCDEDVCIGELGLSTDNVTYRVICREDGNPAATQRHVSYSHFGVSFSDGIDIVSTSPSGTVSEESVELIVEVDSVIEEERTYCMYDGRGMNVRGGQFVKVVSDLENFEEYSYHVECFNRYGDYANDTLTFNVVR